MNIQCDAQTDPGNSSLPLQDNVLCQELAGNKGQTFLLIVADGLGGYEEGDWASQVVTDKVSEQMQMYLADETGQETLPAAAALKQVIEKVNFYLYDAAQRKEIRLGSTINCALILDDQVTVANVGDSRTYLYRQNQLRQITRDHSFAEELVQRGVLAPEERHDNKYINVLTRALGTAPKVNVDIYEQRLLPGDRLLLCSDGLWSMVRDEEMAVLLQAATSPDELASKLIQAANEAGGKDHISVVLAMWLPDVCAEPRPSL